MATYRTAEQRRDLVRSWIQSGLSARQFATSRRLSESSLSRWRAEEPAPPAGVIAAPGPTVDFVRLVPRAPETKPSMVVERCPPYQIAVLVDRFASPADALAT